MDEVGKGITATVIPHRTTTQNPIPMSINNLFMTECLASRTSPGPVSVMTHLRVEFLPYLSDGFRVPG